MRQSRPALDLTCRAWKHRSACRALPEPTLCSWLDGEPYLVRCPRTLGIVTLGVVPVTPTRRNAMTSTLRGGLG